jgi:hypothetical protein
MRGILMSAYLGTEAVANSTNLLDAQIPEILDALHNNGVNSRGSVRVVAGWALGDPFEKVKVALAVQRQRVAVEDVWQQHGVALSGKVVGQQLAVLPDANDVGDEENGLAIAGLVGGRSGEVGVDGAVDLDVLAGGFAPRDNWLISWAMNPVISLYCCVTMASTSTTSSSLIHFGGATHPAKKRGDAGWAADATAAAYEIWHEDGKENESEKNEKKLTRGGFQQRSSFQEG